MTKPKPFHLPKISKQVMRRFQDQMDRETRAHKAWFRRFSERMKQFKRLPRLEQFDLASRLVGDFPGTDGYTYLIYADGADHAVNDDRCKMVGAGNHSCHFHLGHIGITPYNQFTPKHRRWTHGRCFCAQGQTRDQAIGRALKLAGLL